MAKKSFLIIGAGKFGHYICRELSSLGHDIMLADEQEEKMSDLLGCVISAKIGNCSRRDVLETFGVEDFDTCMVCISDSFQDSLQITDMLKELGAKHVVSLAGTDTQAKFLLKNGADEVIFPERDIAVRDAVRLGSDSVFDYIELSDEYSLFEVAPPVAMLGRTIAQVGVRANYNVSIVAIKRAQGSMLIPDAGYVFCADEHLMVMGRNDDVNRMLDAK